MAPLKALELEYPIFDSNFQTFFASHGILSVEDFLIHDLYELTAFADQQPTSEKLKQGITQIFSIIDAQRQPWLNGMEPLDDALQKQHVLSTGCKGIDLLLGGGLRAGQLTELVGPSSSGKTQVCLLAASYLVSKHMGTVVYLDTGNSFSSQRIAQFVGRIYNCMCDQKGELVRLLIIDSISSLITPILGTSGSQGHSLMTSAGYLLKKLAQEHNLVVLVTNHTVGGERGIPKPALGQTWKSVPHVRLLLSGDHGNNIRSISVLKHPSMSFNSLLNVLVDSVRFVDAAEIFGRCNQMGFRENSISYNIMIKGWLKNGELEEARKVFDEMLEKKVQPSVVTYNSLIGFFGRKGELEKATDLLEDMKQKGKYPNAVTYALLMEGLCRVGKYEEANKMMFDMEYRGCKPRLVNYGVLISDLGKRRKIEEAKSLLQEMKKRRFKPDVVIYNILINFLCKEGRAIEAYKVLIEMQVGGFEPNAATYRMMVDGFCQIEDFDGGLKVLVAMLKSKHYPRFKTLECLVTGLLKCGNIGGACFVLEEMEKRNMQLCFKAWEAPVVDACGKDPVAGEIMTEVIYSQ